MIVVRFATLCDACKRRSPEYAAWPTCRGCDAHICPDCGVPDTESDPDVDTPVTCLCLDCEDVADRL